MRMARLEENERNYRAKQDSLYVLTSIKLDEAVRGRIQSEETTKKELLNVILKCKSRRGNDRDADNTQSELFTKTPSSGQKGIGSQTWMMILMLLLLLAILLVVIMKNKQTVYLKPKSNGSPKKSEGETGIQSSSQSSDFKTTQAYENDDVKRSELHSLRQKAVSMSVSEKAGANQIVQDWLGDTESEELESDSENQKEEE